METRILKIDPRRPEPGNFARISDVLRKPGIIAYPTDTFYGLGADGYSRAAVRRIYRLKQRDPAKPLSIVISDLAMLADVAFDIPEGFSLVAEAFWPGPLTVVLPASPRLPQDLQGEARTIGVRLPDHDWLRGLIRFAGFPLTATSANLSGRRETTSPKTVLEDFSGRIDLLIDGGQTAGGLPSTVLDLCVKPAGIIREGAIPSRRLREVLDRIGG